MKAFRNFSLRMRITALTGIIILSALTLLTVLSMHNAAQQINAVVGVAAVSTQELNSEQTNDTASVADVATEESELFVISGDTENTAETSVSPAISSTKAVKAFNLVSIIYMVIISIVGMIAMYYIAGQSLKPIQKLDKAILSINEDNLSERIPQGAVKDEIYNLTTSFNKMLDKLEDSFERQKQFSSNAAHELKTPVATINTNLQVLEIDDTASLDDYRRTFSVIKKNTERLSGVIDGLMALTNEDFVFEKEIISLNALLISIVNEIKPKYIEKNIDIHYLFKCNEENEVFVYCSEVLAHRVFANLIENAMKYNKQSGTITLDIKQSNHIIDVSVSDTGIGIAENELKKIWNAFYCVDSSRLRKMGGTGLGLSIVQNLAARLNWDISVKSTLDKGTTFNVKMNNDLME